MANEITIRTLLAVKKGNHIWGSNQNKVLAKTFDQTGVGRFTTVLNIGTSEEQVTFTDLGTLGWLWMWNLDTTNYVRWGFATTVYGGRMEAEEPAGPFRLNPGASLFLIADTAACEVEIACLED